VLEQGNQILTRVEELSLQLESSLSLFGSALDDIAARIALGALQSKSDMEAEGDVLKRHRDLLQKGETLDQQSLEAALNAAMINVEASLKAEINSSISEVIADPTQEEKLDAQEEKRFFIAHFTVGEREKSKIIRNRIENSKIVVTIICVNLIDRSYDVLCML
jgi:hypothetical protein